MPTGAYLSGRHYFFAHFLYDGLLFFQWVVRTRVLGLEVNFMTNEQRERITTMRQNGCGYTTIAKAVGLTKDNVKAYCRAHNLGGIKADSNARISPEQDFCLYCGKSLQQSYGRKKIKFCSSNCRQQWWNAHPEQVRRKAIYTFTCAHCGKSFTAYGNAGRKYCSHSCYISDRFNGGEPA